MWQRKIIFVGKSMNDNQRRKEMINVKPSDIVIKLTPNVVRQKRKVKHIWKLLKQRKRGWRKCYFLFYGFIICKKKNIKEMPNFSAIKKVRNMNFCWFWFRFHVKNA